MPRHRPAPTAHVFALCAIAGLLAGATCAQSVSPAQSTPAAPAAKSAEQILKVLTDTVNWYRLLGVAQQAANEPADWSIYYENRQIAGQLLGLAFTAARAGADLIDRQPHAAAAEVQIDPSVSSQSLADLRAKLDVQDKALQGRLDAARQQRIGAPASTDHDLQASIAALQVELDLIHTRKEILASVLELVRVARPDDAQALRAQIDAMAAALPETTGAEAPDARSALNAAARIATPRAGLWDLGANVSKLSGKLGTVNSIDERTIALQNELIRFRTPLVEQLRALSRRGDALLAQSDAGAGAGAGAASSDDQVRALAAEIKQIAAVLLPIGKENNLLVQYQRNLASWRVAVKDQTRDAVKDLAIRLGALLVVLGAIFAAAEVSRRTVLTYVQDLQRRHQLNLVRRIACWALVAMIVAFAFVGQFGSVATFAGLMTAGLALAMQSVLVSIVGYFFLIGKHGIRIGDRVQIGPVRGEVIDLGLLRMYLMEYRDDGSRAPTGRVVGFANSVVFQATGGLFKQIPGVDFVWHEITLSVPSGADHASLKRDLHSAVLVALEDYRDEFERQSREIQRSTAASHVGDALPTVRLRYSASGVEAQVRYPVHGQRAAEIDERVSQALMRVIAVAASPAARA